MIGTSARSRYSVNIWPGFVDALASVLIVFIFMLLIFVIAQFSLSDLLAGRDSALSRLSAQINELADALSIERDQTAALEAQLAEMNAQLTDALATQESLSLQLQTSSAELSETLEISQRDKEALTSALERVKVQEQEIELRLSQLASLQADIDALRRVRSELEAQVAALTAADSVDEEARAELATAQEQLAASRSQLSGARADLAASRSAFSTSQAHLAAMQAELSASETELANTQAALAARQAELADARAQLQNTRGALQQNTGELGALRDRSKALAARLATAEERTLLAQVEIDKRDVRLRELTARIRQADQAAAAQQDMLSSRDSRVETLNRQVRALRRQLLALSSALQLSESQVRDQKVEVANLGRRLNIALARQVAELGKYRSEFFGRLRQVLGDRADIEIVGDRFLFQSELLFDAGSAQLGPAGQRQLQRLAATLIEVASDMPDDLPWVLQIDGHTDIQPINTPRFPSNWELSIARALSIVKFLKDAGVPEYKLAAAGYGEFQPLIEGATQAAFRRNRRIEIKLTQP